MGLAAGHGHRVIVEDLVGDVDVGCDTSPQRQDARVVVGAIAQILEHVIAHRERRLADPVGALAAHMGRTFGVAPGDVLHHPVASDAGITAAAFRHHGG